MALSLLSVVNLCILSLFPHTASAHQAGRHGKLHERQLIFDPLTTPIDVHGMHAWRAPGESDQRGPCPALNALANHGYISRDGVGTLLDVVPAINNVFGLGLDIGTLLATLGVVSGGAPVSLAPRVSIGGEDPAVSLVLNGLLGIAGMPQGLNMTHNIVEADSSPTRDDLYVTEDAWTMNMNKFKELLAYVPKGKNLDDTRTALADFAAKRFHETVATNPYFYYGPFSGMIARNAAFLFIENLLANHSTAHPTGQLNEVTLKSFFGVTGRGQKMSYTYGHERIPENWYRRPVDYTLLELNLDVVDYVTRFPELGNIGGNIGAVNAFAGIDFSNLTGGVISLPLLLEDNNLVCFVLQIVKLAAPSWTNNLFATIGTPLKLVLESLAVPLVSLDCPSWGALQEGGKDIVNVLKQYSIPGTDYGIL